MIPNLLSEMAIAVGSPIVDAINSLWSNIDVTTFSTAVSWFDRLNEWLPISDMGLMMVIVVALGAISQGVKWGIKAIELLPFIG